MPALFWIVVAIFVFVALWILTTPKTGTVASPEAGLHVSGVKGRPRTMPRKEYPAVPISDVEFTELAIAPKDEDGRSTPPEEWTWAVESNLPSDENDAGKDVITLEPSKDDAGNEKPNARIARSGVPGRAVVTVTKGDIVEAQPLDVTVGEALSANLSVGTPVHE